VLLLIAGTLQAIMSVTVLGFMIALLNAVNESSYCKDRYLSCTSSSDGTVCADWYGEDALCTRDECTRDCSNSQNQYTTSCTTKSAHDLCKSVHGGAKDVVSVPLRVFIPQPLCYRCTIYAPAPHVQPLLLPLTHPHPPQGFIVIVFGITIVFLLIAGILNIVGGAYCIKAKGAITAMQANGPPVAGTVAVPTVAGTVAVPAAVAAPVAVAVPMPAGKV